MEKLKFTTHINAPRNIVWHALWNDANYRNWTAAFGAGSHAESDWNEGSEILFLGPGPDKGGMYAIIDKKEEPSYMAFKHMGEIKNGKKMPASAWSGSMETYTLNEKDGGTELVVEMDSVPEFKAFFGETWPKALESLKTLAESDKTKAVTIEATIKAPVQKVWELWNNPSHITKWSAASDDWHTTKAENDLRAGGKFLSRMEAKDGSFGFDFGGVYDVVTPNKHIAYTLGDNRKVKIDFDEKNNATTIVQQFDAEGMHPVEFQKAGWQAILNSFKKYTESHS